MKVKQRKKIRFKENILETKWYQGGKSAFRHIAHKFLYCY